MANELIVCTKQGKINGKIATTLCGEEYYSFQGIPYAKPPTGNLRFKSPQPIEPWNGVRDATKEGNPCYARHMFFRNLVGSEDCLFLNVFTQSLPSKSSSLKPVMVWIHGGAFLYGSGGAEMFGPDFLVTQDVVLVTINYRLGLFGFLNFDDPSLEIPGNAGLRDQVMALKWVKDNIKSFNGDPNNVTIFGESAGSASVHLLLLSPMAKGLFNKAILQSGTALAYWASGQKSSPFLAEALKLDSGNEKEILKKLLAMTSEEIILLQDTLPDIIQNCTDRIIAPIVENNINEPAFLPKPPISLLKSGEYNKVPLIIGYTSREGMLLECEGKLNSGKTEFRTDFTTALPPSIKGSSKAKKFAKEIEKIYYGGEIPSTDNIDKSYMLETDCAFLGNIHSTLRYILETSSEPTYFYRFSLETKLNFLKNILKISTAGACHTDELGYLFTTPLTPKVDINSTEKRGIINMTSLWCNFARTGNPNTSKDGEITVEWKPAEVGVHHFLEIGENLTVGINPEKARMQLWDEIHDIIPIDKDSHLELNS